MITSLLWETMKSLLLVTTKSLLLVTTGTKARLILVLSTNPSTRVKYLKMLQVDTQEKKKATALLTKARVL